MAEADGETTGRLRDWQPTSTLFSCNLDSIKAPIGLCFVVSCCVVPRGRPSKSSPGVFLRIQECCWGTRDMLLDSADLPPAVQGHTDRDGTAPDHARSSRFWSCKSGCADGGKTVSPSNCQWASGVVLRWCRLVEGHHETNGPFPAANEGVFRSKHLDFSCTAPNGAIGRGEGIRHFSVCLSISFSFRDGLVPSRLCAAPLGCFVVHALPQWPPWYHLVAVGYWKARSSCMSRAGGDAKMGEKKI